MKIPLIFIAGFSTCALIFAAPSLVEFTYVMCWMACRVLTSGACL